MRLSEAKPIKLWDLEFFKLEFDKELNPAIRCNLFMANPAPKRISAAIGARESVSIRKIEGKTWWLCASAGLKTAEAVPESFNFPAKNSRKT